MVCNTHIRSVALQAFGRVILSKRTLPSSATKSLHLSNSLTYTWNRGFRTISRMMVDSSKTDKPASTQSIFHEKGADDEHMSGGWKSETRKLSCGFSSFRGRRGTMEDTFDIKNFNIDGKTVSMFGVFDGHGGSRAAEYLKEHLFENLVKHPQFMTDTKLAISESYQQTDMDFLDSGNVLFRDDGSTASTAVLVGNHLYVANVGDSRTVISKDGKAIPLSEDHKPNRSDERKRIESAGGVIVWADGSMYNQRASKQMDLVSAVGFHIADETAHGTWRVDGVLAMSRAFGNRMLKQIVVAEPEIQETEIDEEFDILVIASDGLWDVVPNEEAVTLGREEEDTEVAARKLTETAFARGSPDNITCIVVRFHRDENKKVEKAESADPVEI